MSDAIVRYGVFVYFIFYFALAFGWRSYVVYRRSGLNPFVLAHGDDAHGYVGRMVGLVMVGCAIVATAPLALSPATLSRLMMFAPNYAVQLVASTLLGVSLLLLLIAQAQMGNSWRIGIDQAHSTTLVRHGLFRYSRNPIFLSMRVTLLGLCLLLPSVLTVVLLVAGEILMQVQVRLEEAHLSNLHGDAYDAYCRDVRRWC